MLASAIASSIFGAARRSDIASYVGIDIGIDRVRVAVLGAHPDATSASGTSSPLAWLSRSEFQLPVDPYAPPQPDWVDVVVERLLDRLPRCVDGERNVAAISLPIPWIHYQTTSDADAEANLAHCDVMFATSIFQSNAHASTWRIASGGDQLMIAATAEVAARRVAEAAAGVGYHVQSILPHGAALLHAARDLTTLQPSAILLLDLSGGIIALPGDSDCGLFRTLPAYDLPTDKQSCPGQPGLDELEDWIEAVAFELNATCRYVTRLGGTVDTQSPILICGDASKVIGIDAVLATLMERPVATWRYAGRHRPRASSRFLNPGLAAMADADMAVSLSLAYCGTQHSHTTTRERSSTHATLAQDPSACSDTAHAGELQGTER